MPYPTKSNRKATWAAGITAIAMLVLLVLSVVLMVTTGDYGSGATACIGFGLGALVLPGVILASS